jgi:hypothetical protein
MLSAIGECPYDEGGHRRRKEKIVVSNELVVTNRAIIRYTPEDSSIRGNSRFVRSAKGNSPTGHHGQRFHWNHHRSREGVPINQRRDIVHFTVDGHVPSFGVETDEDIIDAIRTTAQTF